MWFADIYCDLAWVSERNGVLGPPRFRLRGARSTSLGIGIDFHFFGDHHRLRHMRALMDTDNQQMAETCLDLNIQSWVSSLEVAVMLETKKPFEVPRLPDSQAFAVSFGQGDEHSPALLIDVSQPPPASLSYERVAHGMAAWGRDVSEHLFYFRRLVDASLPLDVRWLNGYRLLEWHFVGDQAGLARSKEWRAFVVRFEADLRPLARSKQTSVGLLEEARALAAHAGPDRRSEAERTKDPRNAMEKTFRVVERMAATLLNEHPSRASNPIRFGTRE